MTFPGMRWPECCSENSQAAKNAQIEAALKKVVTPMGHEVDNYGMYGTARMVLPAGTG